MFFLNLVILQANISNQKKIFLENQRVTFVENLILYNLVKKIKLNIKSKKS